MAERSWNYNDEGPDVWQDTFPSCAKHSQSPINIQTACTTYQPFTPFSFSSTYDLTHSFNLINNGYTVVGTYNGIDPSSFNLTGGGLNGSFQFSDFHLHWGKNYRSGSEHQVNGVKYAGEVHFVHVNPVTKQIAVLGIFMQSSKTKNQSDETYVHGNRTVEEWEKYFEAAINLETVNKSTVLNLNLALLMGSNLHHFWRYEGSLTTPPCTDGIIWSVFQIPMLFSERRLSILREQISSEGYRGPQPLHGRIVYRNFDIEKEVVTQDNQCCLKETNSLANRLFSPTPAELILCIFLYLPFLKFVNQ